MPTASPPKDRSCAPKSVPPSRTLSLPVLNGPRAGPSVDRNAWDPGHSKIKHSRVGKWRAISLVLIHAIFAIHVAQWLIVGLTLTPVEPSESMYTLRDGLVNAGFVFFVLAIASTLLFGRFFCGWGCHIVAVQDLCAWIMMRLGVKPRPFRSRLLLLVPLGLALYMFAWPVASRVVIKPLFADSRGRLPNWIGQPAPLPGVRAAFFTQDFWATFTQWYIAIPFILVCAAVTVYFLGAKAFCTYGCPYGGIFAPADLLAVGKIRVTDACHHCGHCTAVCTSNVRVHEEVRDFGMVVDPGCMKCLDCISVCPNDALYFGLGKPALLAKTRPGAQESAAKAKALKQSRWDMTWPEELLALPLFIVLFQCCRGMFNQVPMLMAVAMGGLGVWAVWKSWRLFRDADSRIHGFQLKRAGRIRLWGCLFIGATLLAMFVAAWSGFIRAARFRAQLEYAKLDTPVDMTLRPDFEPSTEDLAHVHAALGLFRRAAPPSSSGKGIALFWPFTADELTEMAYLQLMAGELDQAESTLREAIQVGHPRDEVVFELAQVLQTKAARGASRLRILGAPEAQVRAVQAGADAAIQDLFADALARHDDLFEVRANMLNRRSAGGDKAGALAEWAAVLRRHPRSVDGHLAGATFYIQAAEPSLARAALDRALTQTNLRSNQLLRAAGLAAALGDHDRAATLAQRAADAGLKLPGPRAAAAKQFLQLREPEKAAALAKQTIAMVQAEPGISGAADALQDAGGVLLSLGKTEDGLSCIRRAAAIPSVSGWDLRAMGRALVEGGGHFDEQGQGQVGRQLVLEGTRLLEQALAALPLATPIRFELADAYLRLDRAADSAAELKTAADLAPDNWYLADWCARVNEQAGRPDEAAKWREVARRRAEAGEPKKGP